ncbi:hypothetical protein PGUG_02933 [Meyerozyma guilliermondii ATCC 6260]|uniref:37S ribosomal protein, mitochondrial n=1 Tax=Meyerozyma guilliermondii (strain ATCC 6260 / CBS 566 / DSM 6381 / JCM 1539 / NBRC 10279 / NRRL Y-324) TaxID=294746 RepID=A5DI32_PICGU|nr:uncharacterized protein PGUG_02933 [Meyerozyma guilliermondii ATCC 6260]EDK38835.2 hypothetical protein PGUG_02933 [Meyerozyma guilliermondii ATCC 6260]
MGKRALKYGGKSGILPEVRPVFRRYPIIPQPPSDTTNQGYADGVPLPSKKGFKFEREPIQRPVITVEERIKQNIDSQAPKEPIDESKLSTDELWRLKRNEIRREHLREAYLKEAERLKRIDELKAKREEKRLREAKQQTVHEESEATRLTLPTIDSYLEGPIMRPRTEEEEALKAEQRLLNRKGQELSLKEKKATELLELYHAAANFITTEEELERAIEDAFDVNVSKFESHQMVVENKLSGYSHAFSSIQANEALITDEVLGEIDGQPGLSTVKSTLDSEIERLKRQAKMVINQGGEP